MPDMNQPNLQAIMRQFRQHCHNGVLSDTPISLTMDEAIDAVYAGLLAEVINKTHEIYLTKDENGVVDMADDVIAHWDSLREKQRECLKRWCYGGDK